MHLSAARLEAEFSPVPISNVLYLTLPTWRNFGLLRHGGLAGCNACGRRKAKKTVVQSRCGCVFDAIWACHGLRLQASVARYRCSSRNFATRGDQLGMAWGEPIKKCPSLPNGGTR